MDSIKKLLVISSDQKLTRDFATTLENHYQQAVAVTFQQAQDLLETYAPDIVLLDSHLNNESTKHFHKSLSDLTDYGRIAVICLLEIDTLEERLEAYTYGASDVLNRDFKPQELLAKLNVINQFLDEKSEIRVECEEAKTASFEFMKEANQYGLVLQFFRGLSCCNYIEQLSYTLFQTLQSFDLHASLVVRDDKDYYFDNKTGTVPPIERNIFDLLHTKGRVFQFGNRLLLNDTHTAFLIKNLPEDDERLVGQLRDVLALMVEGLEAKYLDIQRQSMLQDVVGDVAESISEVSTNIEKFDQLSAANYNDAIQGLNSSFHYLDLTLEQESSLIELFETSFKKMQFAKSDLTQVQQTLLTMLEKVNSADIVHKPDRKPPDDLSTPEVELF